MTKDKQPVVIETQKKPWNVPRLESLDIANTAMQTYDPNCPCDPTRFPWCTS